MNEANETEHAALPKTVQPLHDRYLAEGAAWRDHLPFTASETVPKLLHAVRQEMAAQDTPASGAKIHQGAKDMISPTISPTAVPTTSAKMQRRKRMIISGALATLLVCVGIAGFYLARPRTLLIDLEPPPPLFHWSATNVTTNMTPQQAFAHGMTLVPCSGKPATSLDVAWIATNTRYGLAMIQGNCSGGSQSQFLFLFETSKERAGFWEPEPVFFYGWPETISPRGAAPVPDWLPLPPNRYEDLASGGRPLDQPVPSATATPKGYGVPPLNGFAQKPGVFTRGWLSNQNYFIGGYVADQAVRSSESISVTLLGQTGWMVQHNTLVAILIPHTATQTYLFIGNFSPQHMQTFASAMLLHVAEWYSLT